MNEELVMKIKTFTGKNPMAPKRKKKYVAPKQPKDKQEPKEEKTPGRQLAGEMGHQLTPKGPGYHSPEEIAADVKEARRIAGLTRQVLSRKK